MLSALSDAECQVNATGKAIQVVYSPSPSVDSKTDIKISVDKNKILQVLANLVNNAIKFTIEGKIEILTEKQDHQVLIDVKDSGTGIDPAILPRLFEKFASKSESGTGLGLFISRNIVEGHGGKMWAQNNKDGAGATFTFTIPMDSTRH
jgi:two-component system sensor histidine kinase VicK